jgi:hypothetical protein
VKHRALLCEHDEAIRAITRKGGKSALRRPQGWWEFEAGDLERPDDYDNEPRFLYENSVLSADERAQLEEKWAAEHRQQHKKEEPRSETAVGPLSPPKRIP